MKGQLIFCLMKWFQREHFNIIFKKKLCFILIFTLFQKQSDQINNGPVPYQISIFPVLPACFSYQPYHLKQTLSKLTVLVVSHLEVTPS